MKDLATRKYIFSAVVLLIISGCLMYMFYEFGYAAGLAEDIDNELTLMNDKGVEETSKDTSEETLDDISGDDDTDTIGDEVQFESKDFQLEYWPGNGPSLDFTAELPVGAEVTDNSDEDGAVAWTKVLFDGQELTLGIPHMGFPLSIASAVEVDSELYESLYRVQVEGEESYFYSNRVELDTACAGPEDVEPPCAVDSIKSGENFVTVRYFGDESGLTTADKIVSSMIFTASK